MTNAIYLTTTEPFSGKSIIALGLMNLLAGKTEKLAYFKPIATSKENEKDYHLETMIKHFGLTAPYEDMYAFTRAEVLKLKNDGDDALMTAIFTNAVKDHVMLHIFCLVHQLT